ncbi:hypothetical protein F2P56_011568 [Juglans regia]|uniref:Uncharacterized protein n=2 Tax=Juglans regia TaxID=51240 RepID=A0A833XMC3_JUGRE|nr:uncharacterized protein LOC109021741 [Juglans regia]KAF5471101.1 hypothetical protein F2P56_011568 [Juglans regia]
MFLWRATHESLPTNLNLKRRKIKEDPSCPICRQEPESVMHALWSCSAVMDVWSVSSRGLQKMKVGFKSFKEVVEHVIAILSAEEVELFACTAYHVWRRRNVFLFEEKFENPSRIAQAALQLTKDFKEASYSEQVSLVSRRPAGTDSWSPPPLNVYKANWDASIDRVHSRMGVGVVIRNWEGRVTATLKSSRSIFPDAKLAEAMAALRAVLLCKQLGISRVLLEGDALNVVNDINLETKDWSSAGLIIQDIKAELQNLEYGSAQFISRNSNCIAHCLAKDALKLS